MRAYSSGEVVCNMHIVSTSTAVDLRNMLYNAGVQDTHRWDLFVGLRCVILLQGLYTIGPLVPLDVEYHTRTSGAREKRSAYARNEAICSEIEKIVVARKVTTTKRSTTYPCRDSAIDEIGGWGCEPKRE